MTKLFNFDVLIVYSEKLAASASDSSASNLTPFSSKSRNNSYNEVYSFFLESCHKQGLSAAFTTSADIVGPGFCRSFWKYDQDKWTKINTPCFSALIFDKFSPVRKGIKFRRQLLFSTPEIKSFNNPELFNLFFDKQKTYDYLSEYSIPTISLRDKTITGVDSALGEITKLVKHHPQSKDFSSDLIMKDQFGAGGNRVHKFTSGQSKNMSKLAGKNKHISYIIQPFINFDKGFSYQNISSSADIRLVYLNGEIVQSYIRVAKSGEFRCNEHRGGLLTYLPLNEIPSKLITKSNLIAQLINKKTSLYALDFIISNSHHVYLLEGNTSPGLDWNTAIKKNEIEAKKFINLLVTELSSRINPSLSN